MANDFSIDTRCKAVYRFESGALETDSKGNNTLTNHGGTANTTNYKEGSSSVYLKRSSSQYLEISDADLDEGFPLKSNDTSKQFSFCFWIRPDWVSVWDLYVISKYLTSTNQRTLAISYDDTRIKVLWGYNEGNDYQELNIPVKLEEDKWYHFTIIGDGVRKFFSILVWDDEAGEYICSNFFKFDSELNVDSAPFYIGKYNTSSDYFDGLIDELVIFNECISWSDAFNIRAGTFTGATETPHVIEAGYQVAYRTEDAKGYLCVDPSNGDSANSGFSWDYPIKKIEGVYLNPGIVVLVSKNSETPQSGTASATTGGVAITTTVDLSGTLSQYDILRFDSDNRLYSIDSITGTSITLHSPYRGSSGSGKTINLLTTITAGHEDWKLYNQARDEEWSEIRGGMNTSSNIQDGFTVITDESSGDGFDGDYKSYYQVSRLGFNYFKFNWCSLKNLKLTDCYSFGPRDGHFDGSIINCTLTRFVVSGCVPNFVGMIPSYVRNLLCVDCDFFPHISDSSTSAMWGRSHLNLTFKNCRFGEYYFLYDFVVAYRVHFYDCDLNETSPSNYLLRINESNTVCEEVLFRNCRHNVTNLFRESSDKYFRGSIQFEYFNRTDVHKTFYGTGRTEGAEAYVVSNDTTIYRTSSPSVKIEFNYDGLDTFTLTHFIPCTANTEYTVSVYMRKNSAYTDARVYTLPKMRVRWITGTLPDITYNEHDVTMSDVDDTWTQLSYTVTPSVTGAIEIELIFSTSNTDAVVWYDDFAVTS